MVNIKRDIVTEMIKVPIYDTFILYDENDKPIVKYKQIPKLDKEGNQIENEFDLIEDGYETYKVEKKEKKFVTKKRQIQTVKENYQWQTFSILVVSILTTFLRVRSLLMEPRLGFASRTSLRERTRMAPTTSCPSSKTLRIPT